MLTSRLPRRRPRHPGGTAEAHPDDLAVCRACAESPRLRGPGALPSAYCPPPPGSPRQPSAEPSRSQAGLLDSGARGRLHEHQPKVKCLFLLPAGSALAPVPPPHPPPPPPQPLSGELSAPDGDQRRQGAVRETSSWRPWRVQTCGCDVHVRTHSWQVESPLHPGRGRLAGRAISASPRRTGCRARHAVPVVNPASESVPTRPPPLVHRLVLSGSLRG